MFYATIMSINGGTSVRRTNTYANRQNLERIGLPTIKASMWSEGMKAPYLITCYQEGDDVALDQWVDEGIN